MGGQEGGRGKIILSFGKFMGLWKRLQGAKEPPRGMDGEVLG